MKNMLKSHQNQTPDHFAVVHLKKAKNKNGEGQIAKKVSRTRRPDDMSVEEWQIALRRQFGREQNFKLKPDSSKPHSSDFFVSNPASGNTYRVAIRSDQIGHNYCSCPDFTTNTLLTCKHIEFILAKLARSRKMAKWFQDGFVQQKSSSVFVRYGTEQKVAFRAAAKISDRLAQLASQFFDGNGIFKHDISGGFPKFNEALKNISDTVHVYDDVLKLVQNKTEQQRLKDCVERFLPNGIASKAFQDLLTVPLYSYQREGALFAAKNGRVLLADEMGLGKTIQALAAAEILARTMGVQRVLIVCPTSLKHQWQSEIEKFAKRSVQVVNGGLKKRRECYATDSFFRVINYDVVHCDIERIQAWQPDLVILDEAQRIKNWQTRTAKSIKLLQSRFAIVLTGTPLENRLEELHSIVSFIDRQRLGPLFRFLHNHQLTDEVGKVTGYQKLDQIGESLKPILLRRNKSQVLTQLPARVDKMFFVQMTDEQQAYHDENNEQVSRLVNKWRRVGFLTDKEQKLLMIYLQNMRMSCNSTYLLDPKTDYGRKVPELITILKEILEEPGVKIVIFSQWVRTHELIIKQLEKSKIPHVFFHGGVPSAKRKDLVDKFKQDAEYRIFLSTDAGGVGLNLQNASVVVNMDQPWNPAVLEQRIGRVHRLGQTKTVRVLNFVAEKTIEEGMLNVLKFKKGLFGGVLDGGDKEIHFEGSRLKKFMETIESVTQEPQSVAPAHGVVLPVQDVMPPVQNTVPIEPTAAATVPSVDWEKLMASGVELVAKFMAQVQKSNVAAPEASSQTANSSKPEWVQFDQQTGQIKLSMPKPETLNKLGQIFMLAKELLE